MTAKTTTTTTEAKTPRVRKPLTEEQRERRRFRERERYSILSHICKPKRVADPVTDAVRKARFVQIKALPVIHNADRFERIQAVMASNREKKYGYV